MRDDLGTSVPLDRPRRVVSLVPSLTEAVASAAPELLVGVTDWCSHPAGLAAVRVGGTKYPKVDRVLALAPDVVLANAEENRREDVEEIRSRGVPVWVTYPRTVAAALTSLRRMFSALGRPDPAWLARAHDVWAAPPALDVTVVVPVWRRPWVVLGGDTFASDVLRRLGVHNVYAGAAERYPRPPLAEMLARRPAVVVLPDEPYAFHEADGPEAFPGVPCVFVSGRHLTWYGPSLVEAREALTTALRRWS